MTISEFFRHTLDGRAHMPPHGLERLEKLSGDANPEQYYKRQVAECCQRLSNAIELMEDRLQSYLAARLPHIEESNLPLFELEPIVDMDRVSYDGVNAGIQTRYKVLLRNLQVTAFAAGPFKHLCKGSIAVRYKQKTIRVGTADNDLFITPEEWTDLTYACISGENDCYFAPGKVQG